MFFPMRLFLLACFFPSSRWISLAAASLPQRSLSPQSPGQQYLCHCGAPGQQHLPDGSPHWHFRPQLLPDAAASPLVEPLLPGGNLLRTDFRCSAPASQQLRRSAPASNKPHPAEKSTPVWLAIWRTWAGFANSQLRCANFPALIYIYASIPIAATLGCCSDRRISFGPSAPIAYATSVSPPDEAAAWPGTQVLGVR